MKDYGLAEEYANFRETERYEEDRYQQAQDVYEWHNARPPLRDDFTSDDEYEDHLEEWEDIVIILLERVKELQRVT